MKCGSPQDTLGRIQSQDPETSGGVGRASSVGPASPRYTEESCEGRRLPDTETVASREALLSFQKIHNTNSLFLIKNYHTKKLV